MLRNYLAAALRNLFRNRAYAALNLFGLALGFTATIVIALFVRDEYSYDKFFPDHERIYRMQTEVIQPGRPALHLAVTNSTIAAALALDFPQIESTTRLAGQRGSLRRGDVESSNLIAWVDPNFFQLFPLRTFAGNPQDAVSKPDGIVLTRKAARRLFGRDDVIGETLELNREHTLRVLAVLEDLPSNTHFVFDIFAPGIAASRRSMRSRRRARVAKPFDARMHSPTRACDPARTSMC